MKSFLKTSFSAVCFSAAAGNWPRQQRLSTQTANRSLRHNFELGRLIFHRTGADHDIEPSRFDDGLQIQIKKRELIRRNHKLNRFALTRRERDALEVFQLH